MVKRTNFADVASKVSVFSRALTAGRNTERPFSFVAAIPRSFSSSRSAAANDFRKAATFLVLAGVISLFTALSPNFTPAKIACIE